MLPIGILLLPLKFIIFGTSSFQRKNKKRGKKGIGRSVFIAARRLRVVSWRLSKSCNLMSFSSTTVLKQSLWNHASSILGRITNCSSLDDAMLRYPYYISIPLSLISLAVWTTSLLYELHGLHASNSFRCKYSRPSSPYPPGWSKHSPLNSGDRQFLRFFITLKVHVPKRRHEMWPGIIKGCRVSKQCFRIMKFKTWNVSEMQK